MERKVMFDINALISPSVEERLNNTDSLSDKIDVLFNLLDFRYTDFSHVEKVEIEKFYTERMSGMPPESFSLSDDEKNFIKNDYAVCFNDFEEIKNLFNEILGGDDKDNALSEATYRIHEEYDRRKKAADESMRRILENLIFDEDTENEDNADNSIGDSSNHNDHDEKSEMSDSAPAPIRRRRLNTSFRQLAAIRASKKSDSQNQEGQS